ncbi:ferredoxin [Thalassococcus sp. S3]|uniref:ferredoxin n=1 Tax=Thalassococcus sp. S3 TaxID=2017482 RepID=UPI00102424F4|nr:ferredoxin [Thalassococcus sp. S3]QBF30147.1 ferredoxin [Thalassococcus sp. S3]
MKALDALAATRGLITMGALQENAKGQDRRIVLLGTGADFWPIFSASPEYNDPDPDPLDRWSMRVMQDLMKQTGASEIAFPFGGPPYAPFLRWAEATGHAWPSPVGMLIHSHAGLMISLRGALIFDGQKATPPPPGISPCKSCKDIPCRSACPVGALKGDGGYDVAACHAYLDTPDGQDCLTQGCKARRVCPVSIRFGRNPEQSAFHMKAFHPR